MKSSSSTTSASARAGKTRNGGQRSRSGLGYLVVLFVLVILVLLAGGGILLKRGGDTEGIGAPDQFLVRRGSFDITVPASGELAALSQTEISSQLETRAVITDIVEEGVWVETGDMLIHLDDEDILNRIKDAEVAVKNADTAWTTAKTNLKIRQDSNISQLSLADVDIKLANLAIRAWREGSDVSKQQLLELNVETSLKEYQRAVARHEASADLLKQQFISQDEYDGDEIAMIRASSNYEQAKLAKTVYDEIEREQGIEKLNADLKKAEDQRSEIAQRNDNEINQLETEVENRLVALNREEERLEKARAQLERCMIIAPHDGLVVYAASLSTGRHGGRDEDPPDVGTELRRNRTVIILPNTSRMVAEVKINEALSGKIRPGQRAVIYSDAVPDTPLDGEVLGVGVLAESGGWRDPNRRDYTVRIALANGNDLDLKPSMRCKANIYVGSVDDATFVPVQAVFRQGRSAFVYRQDGAGYAQQPVKTGASSELFIEITDGLDEGADVLLREPPAARITARISADDSKGGASGQPRQAGRPPGRPEGMKRPEGMGRPGEGGGSPEGAAHSGEGGGHPEGAGKPGERSGRRGDRPPSS